MGKIKEQRFKVHQSSAVKKNDNNISASEWSTSLTLPLLPQKDDIFAGLNINISDIKRLDEDFDATSQSGQSHRERKKEEQHLPKKEKRRRRHEMLMEKLDWIQQIRNRIKDRKKRSKTAVVGDMIPLLEALPSVSDIAVEKKRKEIKVIPRPSMKARQRQRENFKDVKHFRKILNDRVFRSDPMKTITEYLKSKVASERPDLNLNKDA